MPQGGCEGPMTPDPDIQYLLGDKAEQVEPEAAMPLFGD